MRVLWADEPVIKLETGYYQICQRTREVCKISGIKDSIHFPGMVDLTKAICFPWQEREAVQARYAEMLERGEELIFPVPIEEEQ